MVQLDTHKLHLYCEGEGEVTVLLEAGLGGNSLEWGPVQKSLARFTRTCSYDRAGYAWSDNSPFARDARQLANEANQMLDVAGIEGPLVLAGHSFGGFVIRELERLRKGQVVGLVLVDASHEDQFSLNRFLRMSGANCKPLHACERLTLQHTVKWWGFVSLRHRSRRIEPRYHVERAQSLR